MCEPTFPVTLPGAQNTLMWAPVDDMPHKVQDQLRNVANLPWTHSLRVMPDVHLGSGATIGSVIATRNAVSPAAVGVDIGCGMSAVKTNIRADQLPDSLAKMREAFERAVPVGRQSFQHLQPHVLPSVESLFGDRAQRLTAPGIGEIFERAMLQLGTLGGGNHFIELCTDTDDMVWLMLHSGSRRIGKEIADRHISGAKNLEHNQALPDRNLAAFLAGTPEMDNYLADVLWAQDYAKANRNAMMLAVQAAFKAIVPQATLALDRVDCHHNYISVETHDGVELIVTRKGAISAMAGQRGLIPGSMGTGSFVVTGLGNTLGLCSASHGAGRKMSRTQAKREFTVEDLAAQTAGVECRKDEGVVDEIPGAYKNLDEVIRAQTDGPEPLITVKTRLTTLLCVKG